MYATLDEYYTVYESLSERDKRVVSNFDLDDPTVLLEVIVELRKRGYTVEPRI